MRSSLRFILQVAATFFALASEAREVPQFDNDNFEVISVQQGSTALVRSNGHSFICQVFSTTDYYGLSLCKPLMGISDDDYIKMVTQSADASAAALKSAADKAAADMAAANASLAAVALAAVALKMERLIQQLTVNQAKDIILNLAKEDGCSLKLNEARFRDETLQTRILVALGAEKGVFPLASYLQSYLVPVFADAVSDLSASGVISISADGKEILLKECN